MTVRLPNTARQTAFLMSGASKARALREVLAGRPDPDRLPALLVHPSGGSLQWLVDRAAAAQISHHRDDLDQEAG